MAFVQNVGTLYNSTYCRLCAEENPSGVLLFSTDEAEMDFSALVNRYLPFKVEDDGKLPQTICPGCHLQVQSTAQFFDLMVEGQQKLRDMWKSQLDAERKERLRAAQSGAGESLLIAPDANQIVLEADEANPLPNHMLTIMLDDGPIFPADHEIALKMEGLQRPRRRRGRPAKKPLEAIPAIEVVEDVKLEEQTPNDESLVEQDKDEAEENDGRKRRKRKVPIRFQEAVAGKELERVFREEGVIDENDLVEEEEEEEEYDADDVDHKPYLGPVDTSVIGHMETLEGTDLGEVVVNRSRIKPRMRGGKRKRLKFHCDVCGRDFQHRGRFILHRGSHKGVKFECTHLECNKQYSSREKFELHQKTMDHTGEGIVEGVDGGEDCELTSEARFACTKCDKTFLSKQSYEVHFQAIHEGKKPYTCELCSKQFAYQNSLKFHMVSHEEVKSEKGYPCDICGKYLNHPSSVLYHKEAEHNNGRRFVCNKCGRAFKHKQLLQRHQLVHSEDRPHSCKVCSASFKTKANLLNHEPTHSGLKKYCCEICGQQFAHKTSLTLHYRWHTGQKPYSCKICDKTFSQNGNLQEHMRIHTGEKPFCCDYCGRKFTTSSQFRLHVKRHTGERPWKCEYCNKSFLHKDTWKCHTRRHNGERPFTCEYCQRGFTEVWALKKHMRLHTGEKPYTCLICTKSFADCSNLTKHKKIHHKEKKELRVDPSVWSLIRTHLAKEPGEMSMDGSEMIGETEDGIHHQVIYVTYQDPDDPTQAQTLQIVDDITAAAAHDGLENDMQMEEGSETALEHGAQDEGDSVIGTQSLQVTDEEGNPLHFTMQDGRELQVSITTSDGKSLQVTTVDGQTIPLQLMTPDGQHISTEMAGPLGSILSNASVKDQLLLGDCEPDMKYNEDQTIEYTTEDGQKVRLVTTYNVDPQLLASEYLNQ